MDSIERPADPLKREAFRLHERETGIKAFEFVSSFALKTVILQHSRSCKDTSNTANCIIDCLSNIRTTICSAKFLFTPFPRYYQVDITNVLDTGQRVIGQRIRDVVLENCVKASDDVLKVLYKVTMQELSLSPSLSLL